MKYFYVHAMCLFVYKNNSPENYSTTQQIQFFIKNQVLRTRINFDYMQT